MQQHFDPETVDLAALANRLASTFDTVLPEGAVVGRTKIRDVAMQMLQCSLLDAEHIIDTMVARGLLSLRQDEAGLHRWLFPGANPDDAG
jgi:hypothetical protein